MSPFTRRAAAVPLLALTAGAIALGSGTASGSVPTAKVSDAAALPAGAHVVGATPGTTMISATVALQPQDPQALAAYAQSVQDPSSPNYQQYLTVPQFAQRFGASQSAIDTVKAELQSDGLNPGAVSSNGLSISISAPASTVASAFSTRFAQVKMANGTTGYADTVAPTLPSNVAADIQAVNGLNSVDVPQPEGESHSAAPLSRTAARRSTAAPTTHEVRQRTATDSASPHAVYSPSCSSETAFTPATTTNPEPDSSGNYAGSGSYTPAQIAARYQLGTFWNVGDTGQGVTVALYELEGNYSSDVTAFENCFGISTSVTNVPVDGGNTDPGDDDGGETALDIDNIISLAPNVTLKVYQAPATNAGAYDGYKQIITDNTASVISTSWGLCEADAGTSLEQSENTLFQEAATQGQSVVAASGDAGAEDCNKGDQTATGGVGVDDPGSQPYVTSVGGTSYASGSASEVVWNNKDFDYPTGPGGGGSGGGGVSSAWAMPSYQTTAMPAVGLDNGQSSSTCNGTLCREVPDVSALADPETGYIIYDDGQWEGYGGTSGAAPTWAALLALSQQRCISTRIGFLNPILYGAAGAQYASDFWDITSGNNDWTSGNGGKFSAMANYDMASGLGTPKAATLGPALCDSYIAFNPTAQSSPLQSAVNLQLTAAIRTGTLKYSATGLPTGLTMSTSGLVTGTVTANGTYPVQVTVSSATQAVHATFTWTVTPGAVTLTPEPAQTGKVGTPLSIQLHGTVNNGQPVTYGASDLPAGLAINATTGVISGTPTKAGTYTIPFAGFATGATNGTGSFKLTITGGGSNNGNGDASASALLVGARTSPRLGITIKDPDPPGISVIAIALRGGLTTNGNIKYIARGLTVKNAAGRFIGGRIVRKHGTLVLEMRARANVVHILFRHLNETRAFRRKALAGHLPPVYLGLGVVDGSDTFGIHLTLRRH